MKIKDYKLFLESNEEDIDSICQKYHIKNYTINEDGTVDVDGSVNLYNEELVKLPLKFNKVSGFFDCSENKLTTLEGCPNWVGGNFSCSYNKLTTLKGGPDIVCGNYHRCACNMLINFKGFPEDFYGYTDFYGNPIYKLIEKIPRVNWTKFIYWCNEFDVIDDNGIVIPERMEEVYNNLGLIYNNNEN